VYSYLEQFTDEYRRVGDASFKRLYPSPFLVALGMAGKLDEKPSSGTTIINLADGVLERGPIAVGRTSENDVVIPEYSVSRKHCFVALVEGIYRITDWGSANGTMVDETDIGRMTPRTLKGGEILTLGRVMLHFLPPRHFADYVRKVAPPRDDDGFE